MSWSLNGTRSLISSTTIRHRCQRQYVVGRNAPAKVDRESRPALGGAGPVPASSVRRCRRGRRLAASAAFSPTEAGRKRFLPAAMGHKDAVAAQTASPFHYCPRDVGGPSTTASRPAVYTVPSGP